MVESEEHKCKLQTGDYEETGQMRKGVKENRNNKGKHIWPQGGERTRKMSKDAEQGSRNITEGGYWKQSISLYYINFREDFAAVYTTKEEERGEKTLEKNC